MRAPSYVCINALIALVSFGTTIFQADAAPPRTLSLFVSDRLISDGSLRFSLRAIGSINFPGSPIVSLIAPDGTQVPTDPLDDFPTFDSLEDMEGLLFGTWEYRVAPSSDLTNSETYRFTISPFGPEDITVERPRILAPRGQYVDYSFQIIWDPPSSNYGIGAAGLGLGYDLVQPGVVEIEARSLPGRPNEGYVRFSTSKGQSLQSYVSAVTPPSDTPDYDLTVSFAYSRTIERTFLPRTVPEPMAISLAAVSLICGVFMRRLP